ncbi:hypothetical protein ANN_25756 [Periplaneta americana]|uniref:Uncharacterized protein n=1 Tax=Periplaneta americana TaxID=6978 RepID=A0ABQ8S4A6_PERAM|nr:hypothetical protein ANN_25756 [Periplaneta americana]
MAGLCESGNEPPGSLKASDNADEINPVSSTESYPAFARIGLRENPGRNLNQITCPDRDSNPGHLVSLPDALTDVNEHVSDWTCGCTDFADGSVLNSDPVRAIQKTRGFMGNCDWVNRKRQGNTS